MIASSVSPETITAAEFLLRGCVQGIGVRPAIARLALELGLHGTVVNSADGVLIHVEEHELLLNEFAQRLPTSLPDGADVAEITRRPATVERFAGFTICTGTSARRVATTVPPDLAVCDACLAEIRDARDRRAEYAFTSCTNCGPRYSIVKTMPYERERTAMHAFAQCPDCSVEYAATADRRFHAQTNACPACGPRVHAVQQARPHDRLVDGAAIRTAAELLRQGGCVAIKGIGGFQLLCDAASDSAVERLRRGKQREARPLAVMLDPEMLGSISPAERAALESPTGPIVLLQRDASSTPLSKDVAPALNTVGVMRPTSPLHALLLEATGRPLVVTSGNVDGNPLAYDSATAQQELAHLADLILDHDREIVRPIDDSVVQCIAGQTVTIRAARGIAPLTLPLPCDRQILAVGGHQKVAIAISNGRQSVLGPHLGDLDSTSARERFVEQTDALLRLYDAQPEWIVHDLHPDYYTTRWAAERGVPLVPVQHHHAHIVAGMLEQGWLDQVVLGVAFDGTGLGTDDTIWGGEFLRATSTDFQRVGSLQPFPLPGGERAIREPWRMAFALAAAACGREAAMLALPTSVDSRRANRVLPLVERKSGPITTSLGRLFDGVAALVLGVADSSFEGQPAMMLEAVCDPSVTGCYEFGIHADGGLLRLDWRPTVAAIVRDVAQGVPTGQIAMQFHRGVAKGVRTVVGRLDRLPVVLGGGCFQNRILTELVGEQLTEIGVPIGWPGSIPPNDGGLAAGQLAIAAARLQSHSKRNGGH
ncbi:MAG: carbamoyltransferase HypF [Planctomycetaceae bacterium]|nr:carbamoyltransferase HypF [Planctomycetaceae bacterium]